MQMPFLDLEKYKRVPEQTFFKRLGKVVNVVGLTIESSGPDAKLGDLCQILPNGEKTQKAVMAEDLGYKDKKTLLMPYDSVDGIGLGCMVENTGYPLRVVAGEKLLGKTLDGLGRPLDGEVIEGTPYPV